MTQGAYFFNRLNIGINQNKGMNKLQIRQRDTQTTHIIGSQRGMDGSKSEVTINIPNLGSNGEIYEMAAMFLKGYIQSLTQYWIRITHFQVVIRTKNLNSGEWCDAEYKKTAIPDGKVFIGKMEFGEWVDPSGLTRAAAREVLESKNVA